MPHLVPRRLTRPALPYKWTQDLQTVSVSIPLPKGTRARDLQVVLQKRKIKVSRGLHRLAVDSLLSMRAQVQLKSASEPIIDGELFNDIAVDDSSWTIGRDRLAVAL